MTPSGLQVFLISWPVITINVMIIVSSYVALAWLVKSSGLLYKVTMACFTDANQDEKTKIKICNHQESATFESNLEAANFNGKCFT
jgi:hypothetical protein